MRRTSPALATRESGCFCDVMRATDYLDRAQRGFRVTFLASLKQADLLLWEPTTTPRGFEQGQMGGISRTYASRSTHVAIDPLACAAQLPPKVSDRVVAMKTRRDRA